GESCHFAAEAMMDQKKAKEELKFREEALDLYQESLKVPKQLLAWKIHHRMAEDEWALMNAAAYRKDWKSFANHHKNAETHFTVAIRDAPTMGDANSMTNDWKEFRDHYKKGKALKDGS